MIKAARCTENMASALFSQQRQGRLDDRKGAEYVRVVEGANIVRAGFLNRASTSE
jgi:hypothetical protein